RNWPACIAGRSTAGRQKIFPTHPLGHSRDLPTDNKLAASPRNKFYCEMVARQLSGRNRALRCPDATGAFLPLTLREKGSAALARTPSVWAESDRPLRCLYFAIWKDEKNFFAQLASRVSRPWEFQQQ